MTTSAKRFLELRGLYDGSDLLLIAKTFWPPGRDCDGGHDPHCRHAAASDGLARATHENRGNGTRSHPRPRAERLYEASKKVSLRQEPKAYMKDVVESFNLSKWLGTDQAK